MVPTSAQHEGPCLLILRAGSAVFGAYLSDPLYPIHSASSDVLDGGWTGSPTCFLFSATLGVKIPYHGRSALSVSGHASHSQGQTSGVQHLAFCATREKLMIGDGDLQLDSTLRRGSSELEQSYGVGLAPGSVEAMCLLAGAPSFQVDHLEVWAIVN